MLHLSDRVLLNFYCIVVLRNVTCCSVGVCVCVLAGGEPCSAVPPLLLRKDARRTIPRIPLARVYRAGRVILSNLILIYMRR